MQVRVTLGQLRALLRLESSSPAPGAEASERVPAELLARHRWLVDHGCRPPIAATRNDCCVECNLRLPVQLALRLRRQVLIATCPSCQRLIYDAAQLESGCEEAGSAKRPGAPRRA